MRERLHAGWRVIARTLLAAAAVAATVTVAVPARGLAGDADAVYAVVSPCTFGRTCTLPATLWRTTPGQGSWIQVSVTLPAFEAFDFAVLAVHGVVAYLAIPAYLVGPPEPDVLDVTV